MRMKVLVTAPVF